MEVYDFEPKDLTEKYTWIPRTHNRFFFTTVQRQKAGKGHRMSRAAGPGSWVGTEKDIKNRAGKTIGSHETLKYVYKNKSRKTDWRMDEYRCCGLDNLAVDVDGRERVFCRLYVPINSKDLVTLQESLAGDDLPLQPDDSAMAAAANQHQQEAANAMAVQHQQQQLRRQVPANAMAMQQQVRRQEFTNAMAVQQQLLRRQGPGNGMAVQQQQQQQLRRQEFTTAMALQQSSSRVDKNKRRLGFQRSCSRSRSRSDRPRVPLIFPRDHGSLASPTRSTLSSHRPPSGCAQHRRL
ncbi:hypothetical protein ACQ4PT_057010 [Festuca glaucescens]